MASRKYSSSVPSKQSKTVKCDLSGCFSPLRVPRPSICSKRMRDLTGRRKTMNSRSGMSTPVDSRSTVTTMPGLGRLRNSRIRCKRPVDPAGDLPDEGLAAAEDVAASLDELVGVGGVRQVVGGEDQGLGEAAVPLLVLEGVLLEFLEDLAVGVGRGDRRARPPWTSNSRSSSSWSSRSLPVSGSTDVDASRPP